MAEQEQGMLTGGATTSITVGDMTCTLKADGEYECVDKEGNIVSAPAYPEESGEFPSLEGMQL